MSTGTRKSAKRALLSRESRRSTRVRLKVEIAGSWSDRTSAVRSLCVGRQSVRVYLIVTGVLLPIIRLADRQLSNHAALFRCAALHSAQRAL
jgi:hypothetical protein